MKKMYGQCGDFVLTKNAESPEHMAQMTVLEAIKQNKALGVFIFVSEQGAMKDLIPAKEDVRVTNDEFDTICTLFTHQVMGGLLHRVSPEIAAQWQEVIRKMEDDEAKYDWGDPEITRFMEAVRKKF